MVGLEPPRFQFAGVPSGLSRLSPDSKFGFGQKLPGRSPAGATMALSSKTRVKMTFLVFIGNSVCPE